MSPECRKRETPQCLVWEGGRNLAGRCLPHAQGGCWHRGTGKGRWHPREGYAEQRSCAGLTQLGLIWFPTSREGNNPRGKEAYLWSVVVRLYLLPWKTPGVHGETAWPLGTVPCDAWRGQLVHGLYHTAGTSPKAESRWWGSPPSCLVRCAPKTTSPPTPPAKGLSMPTRSPCTHPQARPRGPQPGGPSWQRCPVLGCRGGWWWRHPEPGQDFNSRYFRHQYER